MGLSLGHGPAKVVESFTPSSEGDVPAIQRVRATKLLRVCFPEDALPFAFINGQGALVGFDVDMAQELAGVFDATAEFKRIDRRDIVTVMDSGACDVMVGGIAVTAERAGDIRFSKSYLDETVAFVVQDNLRQAYATWADIRRRGRITIAMPPLREFEMKLRAELPEAQFEHVQDIAPVFDRLGKSFEALALTAERGSAWTLLHPAFTVAVPRPVLFKVPLAFPLGAERRELCDPRRHVDRPEDQGWHGGRPLFTLDSRPRRDVARAALVDRSECPSLGALAARTRRHGPAEAGHYENIDSAGRDRSRMLVVVSGFSRTVIVS